jgi:hypothetical protein
MNSRDKNHRYLTIASIAGGEDEMPKDLIAKLALSKEEISHLCQGGVLSMKIKSKDTDVSVEISRREDFERKGTRIRFKTIDAE